MSSHTIRILHRPPTIWERDQAAGGHRTHRIAAYREVLRIFVRTSRAKPEVPPPVTQRERQGEPALMA